MLDYPTIGIRVNVNVFVYSPSVYLDKLTIPRLITIKHGALVDILTSKECCA
ncbi:MAG: hypothetical protein V1749_03440 [Candidatus Desantisbacteria bacterium]